MSPKIFITRIIPDPGLVLVKEHFPHFDIWTPELPPSHTELVERARGAECVNPQIYKSGLSLKRPFSCHPER